VVRGERRRLFFGLARNRRLLDVIEAELVAAAAEHQQTGKPGSRTSPLRRRTAGAARGG
jgi:hypothetical protein